MGKGICMNKLKQMETALAPSGGQQAVDQMDNQTLLLRYKETGDMELKWALVLRYTDLVRRIAIQTCGLFSGFTQLDDVIHEGILVLLSAVDKYDPEKEVKFEAYIAKRLRGMVIDLVRKQDWIPRRVRQKATRLKRAAEELSIELGHTPSDQEMADYLKKLFGEIGVELEEDQTGEVFRGAFGHLWECNRQGTVRQSAGGCLSAKGAARGAAPGNRLPAGE